MNPKPQDVCCYCRRDWPAELSACDAEQRWSKAPVSVRIKTCAECKRPFHWWFFTVTKPS